MIAAAISDNTNVNPNNIIFTIKNSKLYVPAIILSAADSQKLSKLLSKGFKRSMYWNNYKTSENKITTNEYSYFLESDSVVNRLFVLVYSNQDGDAKRFKTERYYLPKGFIKNYNKIINGRNFYDQPIDSDIKRYEEIRKLITGQGEDYTTRCLLDYEIKNNYRLIAVDLNRQKELHVDLKAV